MDGWRDGWMEGWMEGWMDGWRDGRMNEQKYKIQDLQNEHDDM